MIRTSKAPVPWKVPWREERTYFIRAGDPMERADIEADLAGDCRAGPVYGFELEAAFAQGVDFLLSETPDYAAHLKELAAAEAALEHGEKMPPDEAALLEAARETLSEHWPAYRALVRRDERRHQFFPLLAFRRFCAGWEGDEMPEYRPGLDGLVPLDLVSEIPGLEMKAAGAFAVSLLYASGRDKEGNSARLSSSAESRKTSSSRAGGKAGRSPASASSRKTPSSRSRPGRSGS
jgi:hypothetical protein